MECHASRRIIGYAVTAEVTTNDEDSAAVSWDDYYTMVDEHAGSLIAVMKDVDSRPGRGASFGDGMATLHKTLGVVGVIVDGTVRDLAGIRRVGMPTYAWGTVPGHGQFNVTRVDAPLTAGQLRVHPPTATAASASPTIAPKRSSTMPGRSGKGRLPSSNFTALPISPSPR